MAVAKKATARKPAAKKATTTRRRTTTPPKMTSEVRELAASVMAVATERAMASESLGVATANTKELPGKRVGMTTVVKLDNGTRLVFTAVVR